MSLNLLPSQAKFQMDKIRAVNLSKKILIYFLSIWVVVVLFIFIIIWSEGWWLNNQNTKYQVMVNDYLKSSNEIVVSQLIKFRTKLLGIVLTDRFEYSEAFGIVEKIFNPEIKIKDFELKDKSYFVMSVTVSSTELLKSLESRVVEVNSGAVLKIKRIDIKSAVYSKLNSEWIVSMEVFI